MKFIFNFEDNMQPLAIYNKENETFLMSELVAAKSKIDESYYTRLWDKFKKLSNEYELIYTNDVETPSVSDISPVSRSYFKLWEILSDFEYVINIKSKPSLKVAFVGEAPGGFVQAMYDYRRSNMHDRYYGMSLVSKYKSGSSNIPSWRLPDHFYNTGIFRVHNGVDKTGSLYKIQNRESFANYVGMESCDIVTADGGFDYSNDYNNQEMASLHLIICEVQTCLKVIKHGGTFVLKIFDINLDDTRNLLYLLHLSFNNIHITKPSTSRPANSEKYIVCIGFKSEKRMIIEKLLDKCVIDNKIHIVLPYPHSLEFENKITIANCLYMVQQLRNISNTLSYITHGIDNPNLKIKEQYLNSIEWCMKYDVPVSNKSKAYYSNYFREV
jgi:23S rRNA U2552 (ribose-2'-O)-methylase RlmE/FtsJ